MVRAYDQSVLRLAVNLSRSQEDARDVFQEAFLRVFRDIAPPDVTTNKVPRGLFSCAFPSEI
ncbi:MAG: sigma factor [Bryobacteraceae bacterium]